MNGAQQDMAQAMADNQQFNARVIDVECEGLSATIWLADGRSFRVYNTQAITLNSVGRH